MDLLLRYGANVNEQLWANLEYSARSRTKLKKEQGTIDDVSGDYRPEWSHETPLHSSVLHRQIEATAWLVKHSADASITDSKELSASDIATMMDATSTLKALKSSVETE